MDKNKSKNSYIVFSYIHQKNKLLYDNLNIWVFMQNLCFLVWKELESILSENIDLFMMKRLEMNESNLKFQNNMDLLKANSSK